MCTKGMECIHLYASAHASKYGGPGIVKGCMYGHSRKDYKDMTDFVEANGGKEVCSWGPKCTQMLDNSCPKFHFASDKAKAREQLKKQVNKISAKLAKLG